MSDVQHVSLSDTDTTSTHVITFNYISFYSNYQCRHVRFLLNNKKMCLMSNTSVTVWHWHMSLFDTDTCHYIQLYSFFFKTFSVRVASQYKPNNQKHKINENMMFEIVNTRILAVWSWPFSSNFANSLFNRLICVCLLFLNSFILETASFNAVLLH